MVGELRERKKPGRGGNPRESFEYRESVLVPPSPWPAFGVVTPLGEVFGSWGSSVVDRLGLRPALGVSDARLVAGGDAPRGGVARPTVDGES
jgi:hypothetical protein